MSACSMESSLLKESMRRKLRMVLRWFPDSLSESTPYQLVANHRMIMKHKTPNRSEHSWMLDWLVHQQEPNLWSYERSSRCRIRYSSFN